MRIRVLGYLLYGLSFCGIFLLAWHLQEDYYFNADVGWLLIASKRLLAGGSYARDFFELNPPLILYLYAPAVWCTALLHLSPSIGLRLYVFCLATLSIFLSRNRLQAIFSQKEGLVVEAGTLLLAGLFLVYPLSGFGQREHLVILLTMPYFLLLASRLEGSRRCPLPLALLIGAMAATGFCIKPYFLLVFVCCELYGCWVERRVRAVLRPESLLVVGLAGLYPIAVWIGHPDYLQKVLPLVVANYYRETRTPLALMLNNKNLVTPFIAAGFVFLAWPWLTCRKLMWVLLIAISGFLLVFWWQHVGYLYQMIPVLVMSVLAISLAFMTLTVRTMPVPWMPLRLVVLMVLLFVSLWCFLPGLWLSVIFTPRSYFVFWAVLFAWVLYWASGSGKWMRVMAFLCISLLSGGVFWYMGYHRQLFSHLLLTTSVLMGLLFLLSVPGDAVRKSVFASWLMLGMGLYAWPVWLVVFDHFRLQGEALQYDVFFKILAPWRGQSLYFLTKSVLYAPVPGFTDEHFVSRIGSLALVPYVPPFADDRTYRQVYDKNKVVMDQTVNGIAEDLSQKSPTWILVDRHFMETGAGKAQSRAGLMTRAQWKDVDLLRFFLLNPQFRSVWSRYQYIGTLSSRPAFRFDVYQYRGKSAGLQKSMMEAFLQTSPAGQSPLHIH